MDNNQLPSQSSGLPWMALTLISTVLGKLFSLAQAMTLQEFAYCFAIFSSLMATRHYYILNPFFKKKTEA